MRPSVLVGLGILAFTPSAAASEEGTSTSAGESMVPFGPDRADRKKEVKKKWEVTGTWETHRMIRQEDLGGAAANKVYNFFYAGGTYDITRQDRLALAWGFYQRFLVDQGETGLRSDDILGSYSRYFRFPNDLTVRITPSFTVPVSFDSIRASMISDLRVTGGVSKSFSWGLTLDARTFGDFFWHKYTTYGEGGSANPKWRVGMAGSAEYAMPFHKPLSAGLAFYNAYVWFYNVGHAGGTGSNPAFAGSVDDRTFPGQPLQQRFGGEVFVKYALPEFAGVRSDVQVSFANGDPTTGYNSPLHDGATHLYWGYRRLAQVYAQLSVRY